MKRVLLALVGTLLVAGLGMAQVGDFRQQGMASQVMQHDDLTAAHPSLPIGSRARVTNTATNDEIEVIIIGRIMPSIDRIIDLSPVAAQALGIGAGGNVIVATVTPPLPQPLPPVVAVAEPPVAPVAEPVVVAAPEPVVVVVPEPVAEPEPVAVAEPEILPVASVTPLSQQPISITIHNYIVVPDNAPVERRERPLRQYRGPEALGALEQPLVAMQEEDLNGFSPEPAPLNLDPPINGIVIIPGLPDPHSSKVYRLQVGAYSGTGSASFTMRLVESAGFVAVQERYGNLLRVFVDDVPSRNVQSAVQRLAALGFKQVWVRD